MRSQRLSSISLQVPFSWLGRPISSAQWDRILASYISKIYQIHFVLSDTALVRGLILLSQGHAVPGARPNPCYQGHAALTKEKIRLMLMVFPSILASFPRNSEMKWGTSPPQIEIKLRNIFICFPCLCLSERYCLWDV